MALILCVNAALIGYESVPFASARASSLGNASAALVGIGMNPAAIGPARGVKATGAYYTPYMEGDILYYGIAGVWGNPWSSFAVSYRSYSLSFFSEINASAVHAFTPILDISVGYAVDYHHVVIDDVQKDALSLSIGALWHSECVSIGGGVNGITLAGDANYMEDMFF
ncbi:MAG: hypothetical protein AABZ39_11300, partial [Spirochaetota bacterium]